MAKKKAKKVEKPAEPRYTLEMSSAQAAVLVAALDFYSRVGIGQIEEVQNMLNMESHARPERDYQSVKNALDFVKRELMGMESGQSFGIFHPKLPDHFKVAWDLQQVIRYKTSWTANPAGGTGVNYREPMKSSHHEDLATMEVSTEFAALVTALQASLEKPEEPEDVPEADVP